MGQEVKRNSPSSLIKYEAQIEVSDNIEEYEKAKTNQKGLQQRPSAEDVLNNMVPPRDWSSEDNKRFMQYVSHQKTEREDVTRLRQSLEEALQHRQARSQGICPIREQLLSQAFDEIIRQVTINCPEQGVLLMRVRDEHKMTLAAYQTLYRYGVSFGVRKMLEAQEGADELALHLKQTQQHHQRLNVTRLELQAKLLFLRKNIAQRQEQETEERTEEIALIAEQQAHLQRFLIFKQTKPQ